MREVYGTTTTLPTTEVSTTSLAENWAALLQALASRTGSISLEINRRLRKTG
jgi:hypothetical protein